MAMIMTAPTLRDLILGLEPRLQSTLSAIWVSDGPEGRMAQLSFLLFGPSGTGQGRYATADLDNLPEGVSATGWERWPDRTYLIDGAGNIEDAIRALDADRIVGALDWYRHGDRWLVKAHAGSQDERNHWMMGLRQ